MESLFKLYLCNGGIRVIGNAISLKSIGIFPPVAEWGIISGDIVSVNCIGFKKLPNSLCSNKTQLTSVNLLNSPKLEELEESCFYKATNLTSISLPNTLKVIDFWCFNNCSKLALTSLPTSLTTIGGGAFSGCSSLLLSELPASLTTLIHGAAGGATGYVADTFSGCTNITISSVPQNISDLGYKMFSGCSSIPSMDLHTTSITLIPKQCFYNCKAMAYIDLPSTLTSIAAQAFRSCTALKTVYCRATTPPSLANVNAFQTVDLTHIYVPVGSGTAYKGATNWSSFSGVIEEYNFT